MRSAADLDRGVNLGGVLDRRDGRPGWLVLPSHLDALADAGFRSVRLPVRWWGHSADERPFTLEREFLGRVGELVDAAWEHGLSVVLTMHHADAVCADPRQAEPRLVSLWRQISRHFADHSAPLAFELLNEPRAALTPSSWNALLPTVLRAVREDDPERLVVVGGAEASTLAGLRRLELPPDDHLIAAMHYYEPFAFTHRGADWEPGSEAWSGTTWGSAADFAAVTADLEEAGDLAAQRGAARRSAASRCTSANSAPSGPPTPSPGSDGHRTSGVRPSGLGLPGRTGTSLRTSGCTT